MSTSSPTGMGKDCEGSQRGEKPQQNPPIFDPVFAERVRCAVLAIDRAFALINASSPPLMTNAEREIAMGFAMSIAKEILRGDGK